MVRDRSASASPGAAVVRDRSASASLEAAVVRDRSASPSPGAAVVRDLSASPSPGAAVVRDRSASKPSHSDRWAGGVPPWSTLSRGSTPASSSRRRRPDLDVSLAQQSIAADGRRSSPAFACSLRRPRLNANVGPLRFEMFSFVLGSGDSRPMAERPPRFSRTASPVSASRLGGPPGTRSLPRFSRTASHASASRLGGPPQPRSLPRFSRTGSHASASRLGGPSISLAHGGDSA